MKRLLLTLLLVLVASSAQAAVWKVDTDHSAVHFSIQHMMIAQVRGAFHDISGSVTFDGAVPSAFDITVEVDSLDTGVDKRDDHLESADFFDVQRFPLIRFVSTAVTPSGEGYEVTGNLTLKGVTRPVTFMLGGLDRSITDPWGNVRRGGVATLTIDRRDYDVRWNAPLDGGGLLIGNDVDIIVDFEVLEPR
jgi:polyisoprenoid-binding protein YceI